MKTPDEMWMDDVKKITDPFEMLITIVNNQEFLGYDPYYKDLRAVMLDQAEKICKEAGK